MDEVISLLKETTSYKISDLFEIATPKNKYIKYRVDETVEKDDTHEVPYYSALNHNNGLKGYVENSAFDVGSYLLVGKIGEGAGHFHYVEAPFNFNATVMVLQPKITISKPHDLALYLTACFKDKFDYFQQVTVAFLDETINIPCNII
jgi:hypothetical protein